MCIHYKFQIDSIFIFFAEACTNKHIWHDILLKIMISVSC